ncbi:fungal-specific transcription factor domain-containing protein [Exophiala viscosa]|uniref:Fungal-specific transcription factor domain-containing protein n=2 Tax=Exophiala viscosa TaxID=2486360 RepID=A0AAN6DX67_9EURO|nr:fungal-specific transcription factor domain-containing protein [Exophiala viscosa]
MTEPEDDNVDGAVGVGGDDIGIDDTTAAALVDDVGLMSLAESFEFVHQLLNASDSDYVGIDDEILLQAQSEANSPSRLLDHVPAPLNHPLVFMPSHLLSSSESRFFLHHYHAHTSSVIFPLSPQCNPLRETLLQAAVTTPHLLSALLASACSHYTRLRGDSAPDMAKTIFKFTNPALAGLRAAVNDHNSAHKMETISTALALCTSDVISGDLSMWRTHLQGVKNLLFSAIRRDKNGNGSSSSTQDSHSLTSILTITDPTQLFLMKWFATLDIFAGVSGLRKSTIPDGHYWSSTTPDHSRGYVDEFTGYSIELMPLLAKIGRMARIQQKQAKIALAAATASRAMDPTDSEDEEAADEMHVRSQLRPETLEEIHSIESQLHALFERSAPPSLITQHHQRSPSFSASCEGTSTQPRMTRIDIAEEMRLTHRIFVYAALLHLYRRVQNLPKSHIKPAHAVYMILETLDKLHAQSTASILILWPVFSAGCETDDAEQRQKIEDRMRMMGRFGMGNVDRARRAMKAYWEAGAEGRWDLFMENRGWDIVLF